MQSFIKSVFSNRIGQYLALTNFLLIALSRSEITRFLEIENLKTLAFLLNLPTRIVTSALFYNLFTPEKRLIVFLDKNAYPAEMLVFVFLQWLFIGWTVQTIARALQPKND